MTHPALYLNKPPYRYGNDAGRITDNSLGAVTNIGFAAYNFSHIGIKAIAKRTAKDTGHALVNEYENTHLGDDDDDEDEEEDGDVDYDAREDEIKKDLTS